MKLNQELVEVQKELYSLRERTKQVKLNALKKYWPLHGKKVIHIPTGQIYYARRFDMFNDYNISALIKYELCKTDKLTRRIITVDENEIEEIKDV